MNLDYSEMAKWKSEMCLLLLQSCVQAVTLSPYVPVTVRQTEDWAYYEILSPAETSLQWFVSLTAISSPVKPIALTAKCGTQPAASGQGFAADTMDYLGWLLAKTDLILSVSDVACMQTVFIGVFSPSSSFDYQLTLKGTEGCPNSCSGNGACQGKKCDCNGGFVGVDCRYATVSLAPDGDTALSATGDAWTIAMTRVSAHVEGATIEAEMQGQPAQVCFRSSPDSDLRTATSPQSEDCLAMDSFQNTAREYAHLMSNSRLFVLLHNSSVPAAVLKVRVRLAESSSAERGTAFVLAISMVAALLVVSVGLCFLLLTYRAYMKRRTFVAPTSGKEIDITRRSVLKSRQMWSNGTKPTVHEICYICLEEFRPSSSLSVLQCGHAFHTSCIKKWLEASESCCVCRSVLRTESDSPGVDPAPSLESSQSEFLGSP